MAVRSDVDRGGKLHFVCRPATAICSRTIRPPVVPSLPLQTRSANGCWHLSDCRRDRWTEIIWPSHQTAKLEVYSAQSQTFISSTSVQGQNDQDVIAANSGWIAVRFRRRVIALPQVAFGAYCITFWNRSLQQQAQYTTEARSIVYSRDGKYLYVRDPLDVIALNTQTGLPAGYQGLSIEMEFVSGTLWDTDETNRVYGTTDLGAFVVSVAQLQSTAPQMPTFTEGSIVRKLDREPERGPAVRWYASRVLPILQSDRRGWASIPGMEAYFGSTPATQRCGGAVLRFDCPE
jgi:hypothetical protein